MGIPFKRALRSRVLLWFAAIFVAFAVLYFWKGQKHATFEIVLTRDGFIPSRLEISKGDSVTFRSELGKEFWPASDLHPTHDIYPEFDPKMPVKPDEEWTFVFNKPGVWKFHDHLAPNYRGEITVLADDGTLSIASCEKSRSADCMEAEVISTLRTKGLDKALDKMAELYGSSDFFKTVCHSVSHSIGREAYQLYVQNKLGSLSEKASYCGYGFYHGFMEAMVQTEGTVASAREFCSKVGILLRSQTVDAEGACYHGIGHGTVDGNDPRAEGDPLKIVTPGLALCKAAAPNDVFLHRCTTGVFNSLALMFWAHEHGLSYDKKDPYAFCSTFAEKSLRQSCYEQMNTLVVLGSNSLVEAINPASTIPDLDLRPFAAKSTALYYAQSHLDPHGFEDVIKSCKAASPNLVNSCIDGFISGTVEFGKPGEQHKLLTDFCLNQAFSDGERTSCFRKMGEVFLLTFSSERQKEICETLSPKYRSVCLGDN